MRDPGGGFYSAEDADSEGIEGKFYLWSRKEIEELLGDDAPVFISAYHVTSEGNFIAPETGNHTGENILHLTPPPEQPGINWPGTGREVSATAFPCTRTCCSPTGRPASHP